MRAGLYARVSTKDQVEDGLSLDAQTRALRGYCEAQGWTAAEYVEKGVSASKEGADRPEFRRLLADAEAGRIDVVAVHKLDRFSRQLLVTMQGLARLSKAGAAFVSLSEHIDMSTPSGRLMLGVFALLAQFYSDNLASEVSKGRKERALQGLWNGDLPFGYQSTGNPRVPAIPVPAEAELVRQAFARYATGAESAHSIAGWLNASGARPRSKRGLTRFTKATVMDMLSNPFYAGRVRYRGEEYPGSHEPIVSEDLFEKVAAKRGQRHRRPSGLRETTIRTYLLRGLAVCSSCGRTLVCAAQGDRRRYRDVSAEKHEACQAAKGSVTADTVEQDLGQLMRRIVLPEDWRERLLSEADETLDTQDLQRRKRAVDGRMARLRDLYLDGDIAKPRYEAERRKLRAELETLDAQAVTKGEALEAGEILSRFADAWDAAAEEDRAIMTAAMFDAIYVDLSEDRIVAVKPKEAFLPLLEVLREEAVLFGAGSNPPIYARGASRCAQERRWRWRSRVYRFGFGDRAPEVKRRNLACRCHGKMQ